MNKKNIVLVILVIGVIGSIYYLSSLKAAPEIVEDAIVDEEVQVDQETVPTEVAAPSEYVPDEQAIRTKASTFAPAPELTGIAGYINTDADIRIETLKGKVVLVDFWTYSCINCIRTIPFLKNWHETYADDGLVIIGVHTPEFEFEKDFDNVKREVEKYGLLHPIVQDNGYRTWRAYKNRYWPRKYLVDIDGFIRYDHIGEGAYERTEAKIKELLEERMERLGGELTLSGSGPSEIVDVEFGKINTPEIYFGHGFTRGNFGNPEGFKPGKDVFYQLPETMERNKAYIAGTWHNTNDYMELVSDTGTIVLDYEAKVVNIVAEAGEPVTAEILVDGEPVDAVAGTDVVDGTATISDAKLYNLVDGAYGQHRIEITVKEPGFRIFTFTFG